MRGMERFVSPLLALFCGLRREARDTVARDEWRHHFETHGLRGTFVLFEPARERYLVCNEPRARQRFLPACTFDIANAIAGLEAGSIDDETETFAWDGKPRVRAAWERDHTLATAMRDGAAWMFQEVARRTGKERMREWLDRLDYGNRDMKGGVDLFWLQGALRVSAMEQVRFLARLAEGSLPATQRAQRIVRNALVFEKTRAATLYAKAATAGTGSNAVGWWVGWVEQRGRPGAVFAMNYAPATGSRCGDRVEIARAILREAGAMPAVRAAS